ncbi:hypothetical protein MARU1_000214 [Malassezia arunalokei]|uniref:G3BP-like protein n=1 Tax=Malassezia arunalokei TaxID=1514897 RepID=A0AAJ6CIN0_9BASI|nr:hypothetical protein MARU1_000214 [Malassezia arunalokei]
MSQSTSTQANGTPVPNKASEVGWLFVPQYYTFMNKDPSRLHCFYTKKSTMVHGTENEDVTPSVGQQAIHERVNAIGFEDTKVYVSNVDSQSSADGGIVIQVLGEMSNKGGKWRKFAQTFFLAQQPNGFYVLNDIFRYLKDDDDEKDEAHEDEPQADEAPPVSVADTPAAREATEASQHAAPAKDEATPAAPAPAPAEPAAHAEPKEAPAAPPKTWANLAARGANRWGNTASDARGSSEAGAQAMATAAAAAPEAKPASAPAKPAAPHARGQQGHVFIKNAAGVAQDELRKSLEAQFGALKECQLNAAKGFAFAEFVDADKARRAIQTSSSQNGVRVGPATVLIEKRRPGHAGGGGHRGGRGGHRGASRS